MTALKEYARLESTGLWRPDPEAQRREVAISFGDATLVIADSAGRRWPIGRWPPSNAKTPASGRRFSRLIRTPAKISKSLTTP